MLEQFAEGRAWQERGDGGVFEGARGVDKHYEHDH